MNKVFTKQLNLFPILLIGLTLLLAACNPATEDSEEQEPLALATVEVEERGVPVEVASVETGDIALIYNYTGSLVSQDDINIIPAAGGRIETVLVEVGDEVTAGDTIATIERDVYIAQVRQAQAGLTTAKLNLAKMELGTRPEEIAVSEAAVTLARAALDDVATVDDNERTAAVSGLAQAEANLKLAQSEYDKIAWAGQVGTTPQALALEQATIAYETALAAYELQTNPTDGQLAPLMVQLAQAELAVALSKQPFRDIDFEIAQSSIEQAEIGVEIANLQLKEANIKAPFDGIIAELMITEGSSAGPQAPIARFVSKGVEVSLQVEESRIGQIGQGQSVSLQVGAYPGQEFPAIVTSISPIADPDNHTFTVKIQPIDEEGVLKGGMFADLSVLIEEKQGTTLVPRAAVAQTGGEPTVYVVSGTTVELRTVTIGLADGENVEILSGLEPGDEVVTAGQPNLADGSKVEVVNRL
ncbi:MAG: efflux RND transporter periplasmic adaptor subunit [Chloroflexota bacterium]